MKYLKAIIPHEHAAMLAFTGVLSMLLCLPAELDANPCDKQKTVQQPSTATSTPDKNILKTARPATEASAPVETDQEEVAEPSKLADVEKDEVKSEQAAAIDMKVLTKRLKETDAIGLFTKLAIRNDVTDLMDNVKRYRKKSILAAKIKEIRANFEGLILKIMALLEEDPELSRDLYVGRESIWKSLLEVKV